MKTVLFVAIVGILGLAARRLVAQPQEPAPVAKADKAEPIFKLYKDLKWEKLIPRLGKKSPEMCILRVDPKTKATQMLIRCPVASGARSIGTPPTKHTR